LISCWSVVCHPINVIKYTNCLSVCPSVRLSNAWIVTKRKKDLSRFLHYTKDHLA